MQRMGFLPILSINVNITIDTMLKFDANTEANVDIDAQCERTLIRCFPLTFRAAFTQLNVAWVTCLLRSTISIFVTDS